MGMESFALVPLPNCPLALYPHVQTVPSFFRKIEWLAPPAISIMPARPFAFATESCTKVPSPNCPPLLSPQTQSVPLFYRIKECNDPAATLIMFVRLDTCIAYFLVLLVPSPKSPL